MLLVHYSQTGRTRRLARSFCAPLANDADTELVELALEPDPPFPFPWRFFDFLDVFPETVQLRPPALRPLQLAADARFDLVILCYTVWFLSPSPPITAFLKSDCGRRLLAGTPVVTVVGCRNMWMMAHDTVSRLLADAGARHCDNVVLTDPGPSMATFITTPRWMFTGRRDPFLGLPEVGIRDRDIEASARFGRALLQAFHDGVVDGRKPLLTGLRAVEVDDRLLASERIGRRSFLIWSRLLRRCGPPGARPRRLMLGLYSAFLFTLIITVVPVSLLLRRLFRVFQGRRIEAIRSRYAAPSGDGGERMESFVR